MASSHLMLDTLSILSVLKILLVMFITGSLLFYLAAIICTYQFFRQVKCQLQKPENCLQTDNFPEPAVAILVPVCGLDPGAWANWTSFCQQDYENYEVWFVAKEGNDPAVPVVQELQRQYPDRVNLLTDLPARGPNHKDSNLSYVLENIQPDRLIFADSDICVAPNYIRRVTEPLDHIEDGRTVGMVTCAYIARNPRYVGSAMASLARCCDFMPSLLIARQLDGGVKLGIGVTMALTAEALKAAGGLVYNRIGSDYNLGLRVDRAGYRVALSDYVLESDTGNEPLRHLWQRELRWARTIRFNRGAVYYGQIFCFGTVWALLLLLVSGWANWAIGLAVIALTLRYMQALSAIRSMEAHRLHHWFWLLPLRDLFSFAIWLGGGFGRTIFWRGRRLRISGDGEIEEMPASRN
jgi:ceramide glucosyltransferase